MNTVEEIETAIARLPADQLSRFREWFLQFEANAWDKEIEEDNACGKLDELKRQALEHHKAGRTRPL